MTKEEVKVEILLLQNRANGCLTALAKWRDSSNRQGAATAIPALEARYAVLCAEVDGLKNLVERWDELLKA